MAALAARRLTSICVKMSARRSVSNRGGANAPLGTATATAFWSTTIVGGGGGGGDGAGSALVSVCGAGDGAVSVGAEEADTMPFCFFSCFFCCFFCALLCCFLVSAAGVGVSTTSVRRKGRAAALAPVEAADGCSSCCVRCANNCWWYKW